MIGLIEEVKSSGRFTICAIIAVIEIRIMKGTSFLEIIMREKIKFLLKVYLSHNSMDGKLIDSHPSQKIISK